MFKCCQSKSKKSRDLPLGNVAMQGPIELDPNYLNRSGGIFALESPDKSTRIESLTPKINFGANMSNREKKDITSFNDIFGESSNPYQKSTPEIGANVGETRNKQVLTTSEISQGGAQVLNYNGSYIGSTFMVPVSNGPTESIVTSPSRLKSLSGMGTYSSPNTQYLEISYDVLKTPSSNKERR